ncbi:MAG: cobalt ECF transporter T component CbiQ [Syntrophomonadaceae bacterium]
MDKVFIPDWMGTEQYKEVSSRSKGRSRMGFLRKTLRQLQKGLSSERLNEYYARQDGMLQHIDPRIKLIATISLILIAGLTRKLEILLGLWLLTLILMYFSRLPVLKMQLNIWAFIPLITLLIAVPGMFNLINDGIPLLVVHRFSEPLYLWGYKLPQSIFISQQGAMAGLYLFLRVGLSLSLGVLLAVTTPVSRLLKSLRMLGIPAMFVMLIEMTYRYLVMLLVLSLEMFEARKMRTVGDLSLRRQQAQVGSSIGTLFAKSMIMAEEVYQAMTARCYTGQ